MAFFGGVGVPIAAVLLLSLAAAASAQLSATFYDTSCPSALATIKSAVTAAVNNEPRMGASLLRLHFHDCFVQGCDASVLLNDTATFTGEQTAFPNRGSIRGFGVIDTAKAQVEAVCPQTVSCADILAVAARDSVVALGGPSYTVPLGRRDSTTASLSEANSDLPPPTSSQGKASASPTWLHSQEPTRLDRQSAETSKAGSTASPTSTRRSRRRGRPTAPSPAPTTTWLPSTSPPPTPSTTPTTATWSLSRGSSTQTSSYSTAAPPTPLSAPTRPTLRSSAPTSPRPS